jgi:putative transposase
MPVPKATAIEASERVRRVMETMLRRRNSPLWLVTRLKIVVKALDGQSNMAIANEMGLDRLTVRLWRERWHDNRERREKLEVETGSDQDLEAFIEASLRDQYRSGTPATFSAEQIVQIVAIACELPQDSGYPISHWTAKEVGMEAIKRGIVESISMRQVGRFLKRSRYQTPSESVLVEHN